MKNGKNGVNPYTGVARGGYPDPSGSLPMTDPAAQRVGWMDPSEDLSSVRIGPVQGPYQHVGEEIDFGGQRYTSPFVQSTIGAQPDWYRGPWQQMMLRGTRARNLPRGPGDPGFVSGCGACGMGVEGDSAFAKWGWVAVAAIVGFFALRSLKVF